jgi:hypothetical protein
MNIKLPSVTISGDSTMQDVRRYLVALVDAIERALQNAKEDDNA